MTAPARTIDELARWVAGVRLEDVPERVVRKARLQQISAIAAGLAGRLDGGSLKAARAALKRGEKGAVRLLATLGGAGKADRTSLHAAVLANASATCAFDWDEILLLGHASHSTVVVPLAFADLHPETTLGEVLLAQIAANEVAARLGFSCFFGPQNGQNIPFLHLAGAALAASKLMKLDAERTANALAIALSQPPAALWPSFLGPIESKVLCAAQPAETGLSAAELAAEGMEGPRGILDHERGFFWRSAWLPVRRVLGGLGRAWMSDTLEVKTHAACWYFQAPLDATRAALQKLGKKTLRAEDVKRVRCGATLLGASVDALARTRTGERISPNEMNFRLDLSIALFLLSGRLTPVELTEAALSPREPELRALGAKVEVRHELDASRRLVAAIDGALEVAALLGEAGVSDVVRALLRARREYAGMPGPSAGDAAALVGHALSAMRSIARARGADYDFGGRGEALAALALPCGGAIEIELADGSRAEATADVPEGALVSLERAEPLVMEKLALALSIAGRPGGVGAARALLELPLGAPASGILDRV